MTDLDTDIDYYYKDVPGGIGLFDLKHIQWAFVRMGEKYAPKNPIELLLSGFPGKKCVHISELRITHDSCR